MTKARPSRNGEDARDLVAALVSNVSPREEGSRLCRDAGRLHQKIKAMHRVTDRLHRKIEGTHGSGFSDRKVTSVVAGRAGLRQRADRDAAIEWD